MTDFYNKTVTLYHSIKNPAERKFKRYTMKRCNIQGGFSRNLDGTVANTENTKTIISKDLTVPISIGDYIIFGDVLEPITNALEFAEMQKKYRGDGIIVKKVTYHKKGMATDNVQVEG